MKDYEKYFFKRFYEKENIFEHLKHCSYLELTEIVNLS